MVLDWIFLKLCILLIGWSRSVQPILSRAAEEVLTYEALR